MSAAPEVVHCDNHLLVVSKQAGMPTVPDSSGDASLLEWCKAWVKERYAKPGEVFLGVVQRLDRPVSGVLVFARTSKSAARLSEAFRGQGVRKEYWGAVDRRPGAADGVLEHWLLKDAARNQTRVVSAETSGAKRARTEWSVLEERGARCLLSLRPRTGRAHQLRVAAASLGAPLLGDLKYGGEPPLEDRSIALHAHCLELPHPTQAVTLRFRVPAPPRPWWSFDTCDLAHRRGVCTEAV